MNILIFVISMILLLATLTYERMSSYLHSSLSRKQWQEFMQKDERGAEHLAAYELYVHTTVRTSNPKSNERIDATAWISFAWIADPSKREQKPAVTDALASITRRLIDILYADQPFYQELVKDQPGFMDKIMATLQNPRNALGKPLAIKKVDDLSYIAWEDHQLHMAFNRMLNPVYDSVPPPLTTPPQEGTVIEEDAEIPAKDHRGNQEGYTSLKGFITFDSRYKIRVFRTPREILLAIYGAPELVEEIIKARDRLYHEVMNGRDAKEASTEFEEQFSASAPPQYAEILNYQVNKTAPEAS